MSQLQLHRYSRDVQADALVVMPAILGGHLVTKDGLPGDLAYRANTLAITRYVDVVAEQRVSAGDITKKRFLLGLPRAQDPSDHVRSVVETAQNLERLREQRGYKWLGGVGVSAGVVELLDLAKAGVQFDGMALFDPNRMEDLRYLPQPLAEVKALGSWAAYMVGHEVLKPASAKNQHGLPYKVGGQVAPLADIAFNARTWTDGRTKRDLLDVASGRLATGTTRLTLPGMSFNNSPDGAQALAGQLNDIASVYGVDMRTVVNPELRHSYTDDPFHTAELVDAILPPKLPHN